MEDRCNSYVINKSIPQRKENVQVQEIISNKSQKNLKKAYNRINKTTIGKFVGREQVLFLAVGGYNRTHDLLLAMGLKHEDIATFQNLQLSNNFLQETHMKKVVYIRKINYVTSVNKSDYSSKTLDLNIADNFEEQMMIYKTANRKIIVDKRQVEWVKPTLIVLDDQSLNLQFGGHRFYYQNEIGFVQVRNRNVDPAIIINEIQDVEETDYMMFALYQTNKADETEILDAINKLRIAVSRLDGTDWYMKPTEFKKTVGSNEMAQILREMPELNITQLKSNKKIGKENARWIIIPSAAFEFKGFDYKDEEELFEEEITKEAESEEAFEKQQEELLNSILLSKFPLNLMQGYVGRTMQNSEEETLQSFLNSIDDIEEEQTSGIKLLNDATTEKEYNNIKKHNLVYFLDGKYENNERDDKHYLGGKQLISIDLDDGNYEREEVEDRLEAQGLFGLVYPTAKYYYDQSARWRIVLMADREMTKEEYKAVVEGVGKMLGLEIDDASKKLSQLMGYPFAKKDVSIVIGTKVSVNQFEVEVPKQKPQNKVLSIGSFGNSNKSLADFNHGQARLLKQAMEAGIPEGQRNESYRQIVMYLRDTLENQELSQWHDEAQKLLDFELEALMHNDGLEEKEMELIKR